MNKILEGRVRRVAMRVEDIVKREFGLRWWKLKPEDELRCLRLVQWEEKYKVSLDWIFRTLVPIWKKKFSQYSHGRFGVKLPTLVGAKSEEILIGKIRETWPDGENIRQWQCLEQQRQWSHHRAGIARKEDWNHPMQAALSYQQRMIREREKRKQFEKVARRRRYRGNPWSPQ